MSVVGASPAAAALRPAGTSVSDLLRQSPVERVLTRLGELGCDPQAQVVGEGWRARCPAHDDRRASLTVGVGEDGRALVCCHGRCERDEVLRALRLAPAMLFGSGARASVDHHRAWALALRLHDELLSDADRLSALEEHEGWTLAGIEALSVGKYGDDRVSVPERDSRGRVIGHARYAPRSTRRSKTAKCLAEGRRGLVYPPGVLKSERLHVVEGPACALAVVSVGLEVVGFASASNVGTAAGWTKLATGREVVLMPDADAGGREAVERIAEQVASRAVRVIVAELHPDARDGRDVADVLRDHGADETRQRIAQAEADGRVIPKPKRGRPPAEREQAREALLSLLSDGQWHTAEEVNARRPRTVGQRTWETARSDLKRENAITRRKMGGGGWSWKASV